MYQVVNEIQEQHIPTNAFLGLNRREEVNAGEFKDVLNMTNDEYPVIKTRKGWGIAKAGGIGDQVQGALLKKQFAIVRNKFLYYGLNDTAINSTPFTSGEKQLVSMGAYVIVFPDGYYYNTEKPSDKGYIERRFNTGAVTTSFTLCKQDGTAYSTPTVSSIPPDNPTNGELWIDTNETPHVLKQWADTSSMWVTIPTVYCKIGSANIGKGLKMYDSVEISGIVASGNPYQEQLTFLNGTMIVYDCGDDYIVVAGIIDGATTVTDDIHVDMTMPSMDFVCESNNRLWGCKYGIVGGEPINEIYACKLGDFRNWRSYMGLSTDSYTVSLGSDGEFTGCVNYLGYPIFFKEGMIHKIYGTMPSNYQVQNTVARGVKKGSWRSLTVIDEILYYRSPQDVVAYDGSLPASISDNLGDINHGSTKLGDGTFGDLNGTLAAQFDDSSDSHFLYNPKTRTWVRTTYPGAVYFGSSGGKEYSVDGAGNVYILNPDGSDSIVEWESKPYFRLYSARMAYGDANNTMKLLKVALRMRIDLGAFVRVMAQYDEEQHFTVIREFHASKLGTYVLPIFIKKCDHVRLGIEGEGDVTIFSIDQIYTEGANR